MTNTHLKTLGILDMTPTDLEMNELTPQRLDEVIDEVTRTIGTNTDLDMREFLGIVKALTRITGELKNNVSKLTEICLLYTSPSPRDGLLSRMPSSA